MISKITEEFGKLREWFSDTYGNNMNIISGYNKEDKRHEYVMTFFNKYGVEKCSAAYVEDILLDNELLFNSTLNRILPTYKKLITSQMA